MTFDVFSFKENELYGSTLPKTNDDLEQLKKIGIKIIVSFEEEILKLKSISSLGEDFEHHEIFITDFDVPNKEQVIEFLEIMLRAKEEKKPVLVHCYAGCGRTGVMLALAERLIYGVEDGMQAILNLREVRPCSVETPTQIEFVKKFEWKKE